MIILIDILVLLNKKFVCSHIATDKFLIQQRVTDITSNQLLITKILHNLIVF